VLKPDHTKPTKLTNMERSSKYSGGASSRRTKQELPRGGSSNTNYYGNAYNSAKTRRYDDGDDDYLHGSYNRPVQRNTETNRSHSNRRYNNPRNQQNKSYGHYGQDRDDRYSQAIGMKEGYLREDNDYPTYSRYEERRNSRRGNYMYDNSTARNTGDYRYQNVGGGWNSRYNTFDDDRDYYRGFREFDNGRRTGANYHSSYNTINNDRSYERGLDEYDSEHRNYSRWRGRRIR
jgi:hypothetical protein